MRTKLEQLKPLFQDGTLKEFHLEVEDYRIIVEFDPNARFGVEYHLSFKFREFWDCDQAHNRIDLWEHIERYMSFIEQILEDPTPYIEKMRKNYWIEDDMIFETIKEIRGEDYNE